MTEVQAGSTGGACVSSPRKAAVSRVRAPQPGTPNPGASQRSRHDGAGGGLTLFADSLAD